jgi:pteridine reductase
VAHADAPAPNPTSAPITGSVALVTGGAKRLGRAIALRLAAAGADIVIHHHESAREARELAAMIRETGRMAWTTRANLAKPREAERLVPDAAALAKRPINYVVNGASIFPEMTVGAMTYQDLEASVLVNAWAPFAITRALAMQNVKGAVVNMLDSRITDQDWKHVPYLLSKQMLAEMTRVAALEYAPDVRVNAVAPGPILPPPGKGPEALAGLPALLPLRRIGTPEEVADAVLHLLAASYTTGQVLYVDGGRHVGRARH